MDIMVLVRAAMQQLMQAHTSRHDDHNRDNHHTSHHHTITDSWMRFWVMWSTARCWAQDKVHLAAATHTPHMAPHIGVQKKNKHITLSLLSCLDGTDN
jgi:hypothetical protein